MRSMAPIVTAIWIAAIWARDKFEQVEDGVYRGEDYDAVTRRP